MVGDDRGQASLLALLWLAIVAMLALGLAEVGRAVIDVARASSAADAAALAAAAGSDSDAHGIAARNDAEIVAIERFGREVRVLVRVGDVERSARAERLLAPLEGTIDARPLVVETIEYTFERDRNRRPGRQRVSRRDGVDRLRRPPRRVLRR